MSCNELIWLLASIKRINNEYSPLIDESRYKRMCIENTNKVSICEKSLKALREELNLNREVLVTDPKSNTYHLLRTLDDLRSFLDKEGLELNDVINSLRFVLVGKKDLIVKVLRRLFRECKDQRREILESIEGLNNISIPYEILNDIIRNSHLYDPHLFRYAFYLALKIGIKDYNVYSEYGLGSDRVDILIIKDNPKFRKYYDLVVVEVKFCSDRGSLLIRGQEDPTAQLRRYVNVALKSFSECNSALGLIFTNCNISKKILLQIERENAKFEERSSKSIRLEVIDKELLKTMLNQMFTEGHERVVFNKPFLYHLFDYLRSHPSLSELKILYGDNLIKYPGMQSRNPNNPKKSLRV